MGVKRSSAIAKGLRAPPVGDPCSHSPILSPDTGLYKLAMPHNMDIHENTQVAALFKPFCMTGRD